MRVLITGGAGFIGSAVARQLIAGGSAEVAVVDKLTYAGHEENLREIAGDQRLRFVRADICDRAAMNAVFADFQPTAVMHLAAESHVDRSISGPSAFVETNILGTFVLLETALAHWSGLDAAGRAAFRFLHVSTDEVFGSLGDEGAFSETSQYQPNSPYSASKASADHLVRAWHHTYGLPVVTTNCSNNYGPYQFPEKLIPLMITNALAGRALPVYGKGDQVRDWLYVEDHAGALIAALRHGRVGEVYCIGGDSERANLEVVEALCAVLDEECPDSPYRPHKSLVAFVADRPGHDQRYAMDAAKIKGELGWMPATSLESGLRETVRWYLANRAWVDLRLRDARDRLAGAETETDAGVKGWKPDGLALLERR